MGGVPAQLGGDEGVGTRARGDRENLLGGQRGEEFASAIGGARAALPGEAVQEDRGQGRVDAHRVQPRSGYSPTRASTGSSAAVEERNQEVLLGSARTPRERSIEAPGTDAGEVERLARRLEAVSQRMADFCAGECWNRRWRTLSLWRGDNKCRRVKQRPRVGHVAGRRRMELWSAPDVSPPRLQPEGPPIAFVRGETLVPSTARPKVPISRKSPASVQSSFSSAERIQ